MAFESKASFIHGIIAGTGLSLAIISVAFLQMVGPLEGKMGVTANEIRIAVFLGLLVFTISLLYEVYRKKDDKRQSRNEDEFKQRLNQE